MRLFGIETEYGIARHDRDEIDPVVESMELVRAYLMSPFERRWDYGGEDPHEDARGFRVSGLAQDKEEDLFARLDAHRPFSFHEMKSDLVLSNGARFYNDHTHPEYSTPECRTLKQLVAHDRAGERIVQQAADRRNRADGGHGRPSLQEQHRFSRPQLWLPRQLSCGARDPVSRACERTPAVSRQPAGDCRRRKGRH